MAAGLDRLGLGPGLVLRPAHRRVPDRRTAGASGELALPPRPGPGRVLGRQPGLPARVQPPPGDDLHPDLARDAAQADGLRLAGAGTGQRVGPAPAQGDDAALERAARAERVLRRDVREVLRVRRRAGAARPAAQRPAGPRGGRRLGRGEEARAGPAHRPAAGALLPDLPGPGPPARDSVRAAAGPRADAPRAGRRRAPDAAHPLPGQLQALRAVRAVRHRRVAAPRRHRADAARGRPGDRLLVGDVRLRQHRQADGVLHLRLRGLRPGRARHVHRPAGRRARSGRPDQRRADRGPGARSTTTSRATGTATPRSGSGSAATRPGTRPSTWSKEFFEGRSLDGRGGS